MKKVVSIMLVFILVASLAGCASKDDDWRQFLKEYESWVDDYIALAQKMKNNPADVSIMSDYNKMVSEASDWTKRADSIKDSIKDANELAEFSAELLRLSGKIASALS